MFSISRRDLYQTQITLQKSFIPHGEKMILHFSDWKIRDQSGHLRTINTSVSGGVVYALLPQAVAYLDCWHGRLGRDSSPEGSEGDVIHTGPQHRALSVTTMPVSLGSSKVSQGSYALFLQTSGDEERTLISPDIVIYLAIFQVLYITSFNLSTTLLSLL